jgi:hypothetical protein
MVLHGTACYRDIFNILMSSCDIRVTYSSLHFIPTKDKFHSPEEIIQLHKIYIKRGTDSRELNIYRLRNSVWRKCLFVRGAQSCLHFYSRGIPLTKWNNVTVTVSYGRYQWWNCWKWNDAVSSQGRVQLAYINIQHSVGEVIQKCSEVKGSEVRMWRGLKCSEVEWREGYGEMWVHQFMTLRISLLLLFSV